MVSVGVDVSKGKSTVCFMHPYGEVLISPYNVQHCEKDLLKLVEQIHVAKIAALNKFLRIYYARIKELYR